MARDHSERCNNKPDSQTSLPFVILALTKLRNKSIKYSKIRQFSRVTLITEVYKGVLEIGGSSTEN